MIGIIKSIALLCSVNVATSGIARDARIDSYSIQKQCQSYYANCLILRMKNKQSYDLKLLECIKDNK